MTGTASIFFWEPLLLKLFSVIALRKRLFEIVFPNIASAVLPEVISGLNWPCWWAKKLVCVLKSNTFCFQMDCSFCKNRSSPLVQSVIDVLTLSRLLQSYIKVHRGWVREVSLKSKRMTTKQKIRRHLNSLQTSLNFVEHSLLITKACFDLRYEFINFYNMSGAAPPWEVWLKTLGDFMNGSPTYIRQDSNPWAPGYLSVVHPRYYNRSICSFLPTHPKPFKN